MFMGLLLGLESLIVATIYKVARFSFFSFCEVDEYSQQDEEYACMHNHSEDAGCSVAIQYV
jgi:hypothetical protein